MTTISISPAPHHAPEYATVYFYDRASRITHAAGLDFDTFRWATGHLWQAVLDEKARCDPSLYIVGCNYYRMPLGVWS